MKKISAVIVALFTVSLFTTSPAWSIPCTTEAISSTFNQFISEQPLCITPCEAAKVNQKIYEYGLHLLAENCPPEDMDVRTAFNELHLLLAQAKDTIQTSCH